MPRLYPQITSIAQQEMQRLKRGEFVVAIVLVVLCLVAQSVSAAVLAVDYGTEWTKAALVKPGIPLQIVLTKDTKRKEQSVVAFKQAERFYGTDAFNLVFTNGKLLDDR